MSLNIFKLENLTSLPAKGYAYLFAKPDKSLNWVDENGVEKNLLAGFPDANLPVVANIPYTAFDFTNTPNGALPANDAYGNPFFLYVPVNAATADATPIVDNGSLRVTAINASGCAFYMGLKASSTIYEMGGTVILGDGAAAFVITQGTPIFTLWSWPLHLVIGQYGVSLQIFASGAGITLATAGVNLSKTEPINVVVKFKQSTAYVFIDGVFVVSATDSRISSYSRTQSIFEAIHSGSNVAFTRWISGYVKTSKQASSELVGVNPALPKHITIPVASAITLTSSDTLLLNYTFIPNIKAAIVCVRLHLNQTSAGNVQLNVRALPTGGSVTNNYFTISKTIKDEIVTASMYVTGFNGGNIAVAIIGAFGTLPIETGNDAISVSIIPTAYY